MRCPNHVTLSCPFLGPTLWEPMVQSYPQLQISLANHLHKQEFASLLIKNFFEYCARTSMFMCESKGRHLVINSSYHTYILFILSPLSYNTTYSSWSVTFYNYPYFTMLVWLDHWWSRYAFALVPLQKWTYNSPQHISKYYRTIALENETHV